MAKIPCEYSGGVLIEGTFDTHTVAANSTRTTVAHLTLSANHTYIISGRIAFTTAANSIKVMGMIDNVAQIYNANGMVDGGGMVLCGLYKPTSNVTINMRIEQSSSSTKDIGNACYLRAFPLD